MLPPPPRRIRRRTPHRASPRSSARSSRSGSQDGTFQASIDQREGAEEWVFYDGPPFANGLPHYGHLLTGYAKDLFPRFQTMRGKQVHRRFGWDTHGLPAELEAMKQLGITEKSQIEEMGIAAFNAEARESVLRYTQEWEEYVTRQARWVDFEHDYKTLDIDVHGERDLGVQAAHDKGLAYEGYRVLPYCWRDQTPLSNHELRMDDDVYKMRQDQSVTVTFPLDRREGRGARAHRRARPRVDDDAVDPADQPRARGRARHRVRRRPSGPLGAGDVRRRGRLTSTCSATDTIGCVREGPRLRIAPPRLWQRSRRTIRAPSSRACTTTGSGTTTPTPRRGAPRTPGGSSSPTTSRRARAPASCTRHPPTARTTRCVRRRRHPGRSCRSTTAGEFLPGHRLSPGCRCSTPTSRSRSSCAPTAGCCALASYEHSYPHCWRCRNPLIYKAVSSWFVRVPEFRDRMVELNQRDQLGARQRQGRPVRQVARQRPRLVDQPQPLLGLARSRCGRATTPSTRAWTCTARSPSSSATSARCRATRGEPTCTARTSTS